MPCNHATSSCHISIPCHHTTSSCHLACHVIMPHHHAMSACHIIMQYQHAMSSCHITMPCHHATSSCHVSMPHHHAMLSCNIIMTHYHAMSSECTFWLPHGSLRECHVALHPKFFLLGPNFKTQYLLHPESVWHVVCTVGIGLTRYSTWYYFCCNMMILKIGIFRSSWSWVYMYGHVTCHLAFGFVVFTVEAFWRSHAHIDVKTWFILLCTRGFSARPVTRIALDR